MKNNGYNIRIVCLNPVDLLYKQTQTMKQNLVKNSKGQYNYQFLFIGGGFNDVWASNKTEAIKLANQKFPSFKVQESTFVKATSKMMEQQDKMGRMMFN